MKRKIGLLILLLATVTIKAQVFERDDNDGEGFNDFRKSMYKDFNNFRSEIMQEFINFVRNPWKEFDAAPPQPAPKEIPTPPIVRPDVEKKDDAPREETSLFGEEVLMSFEETPQPQPVEPVKEIDKPFEQYVKFTFFGTEGKVRFNLKNKVILSKVNENAVADALEKVSTEAYNNMLVDCIKLRKELKLSDWAYLNMLKSLSEEIYGNDLNSATLLTAYLYMQSGYKMRLASYEGRLFMLFSSDHLIYEKESYMLDGCRFYSIEELPGKLFICNVAFEQEQSLSLLLAGGQCFDYQATEKKEIKSVKYPDFTINVSVNKNLLDFYSTYPTSMIGNNTMTRWAMYANTPFDKVVANEIYPQFSKKLEGLTDLEAVNRLLDFVQTGFVYEYDDKVWGRDRIFFPDEAIFYPYNDCDDRSVLFSRLVRDLVGLDVALVTIPGHILVAVKFKEEVAGESIEVNGERYVLCEPTCVNGAPVGWADVAGKGKISYIKL